VKKGALTIVGTGIKAVSHLTVEARLAVQSAEKLFYLVADPVTAHWLEKQNPSAESLFRFYGRRKDRTTTYLQMVRHVLRVVRRGRSVCVAFYGHPGVFAFPPHEAARRAKAEGYRVRMLPGISAEDCLIADVGLDPGRTGCQSFEASDFLINHRRFDDTSLLILWQIGVIGERALPSDNCNREALRVLVDRLCESYAPSHRVIVYESAVHLAARSKVLRIPLSDLPNSPVTAISTLCIPPNAPRPSDEALYRRLFFKKVKRDTA
jgi:precorrin-6B methylase 1